MCTLESLSLSIGLRFLHYLGKLFYFWVECSFWKPSCLVCEVVIQPCEGTALLLHHYDSSSNNALNLRPARRAVQRGLLITCCHLICEKDFHQTTVLNHDRLLQLQEVLQFTTRSATADDHRRHQHRHHHRCRCPQQSSMTVNACTSFVVTSTRKTPVSCRLYSDNYVNICDIAAADAASNACEMTGNARHGRRADCCCQPAIGPQQ